MVSKTESPVGQVHVDGFAGDAQNLNPHARRYFLHRGLIGIAALLGGANLLTAATRADMQSNLLPIPERLVVLTFDDGIASDCTYVAPILKRFGFGGSFYITERFADAGREGGYLNWADIQALNRDGFEIGNHTRSHFNVTTLSKEAFTDEVGAVERRLAGLGIPPPLTFVYPGFKYNTQVAEILLKRNYFFARRGVAPEYCDDGEGERGPAYDPTRHHPLLIPTTGYAGPKWRFEDLVWAIEQAQAGKIAVLNFHGVPYPTAPWVSTTPNDFERYMCYLKQKKCTVVAMRDLVKYVRPGPLTAVPLQIVNADTVPSGKQLESC